MLEALQFDFFQNALFAGLVASIICGIMGTLVVVNRIVFLSGGIAHAAYGGVGLAFYLKWPYLPSTMGFSFFAAMIMAMVSHAAKHRADTIIGVIWAFGMAFGIIMIDITPGYNADLMSYLFGSILTVTRNDIYIMIIIALLMIILARLFYKDLIAMSYDEEFAKTRGVPVVKLYFSLIGMLAITTVLLIQIVGLILVIALLTIPPFIAEKYVKSLFQMMVVSSLLGAVFTVIGLMISYRYDLTSGASIIMVSAIAFIFSLILDRVKYILRV
ncbi:MAG: metal ABC transporter permease [Desulfatiglans sp.]|nr:metal ABC transporter permease [Desulfatiglans sp.]